MQGTLEGMTKLLDSEFVNLDRVLAREVDLCCCDVHLIAACDTM